MVRRTKEEALATRDRILDTAELLFQQRGVSRTSLHELATAAGVTRGAIYWHFQDKADVFNAMMARACHAARGIVRRMRDLAGRRPAGDDPRRARRHVSPHDERRAASGACSRSRRTRSNTSKSCSPCATVTCRCATITCAKPSARCGSRCGAVNWQRVLAAHAGHRAARARRRADPELDARSEGLRPRARRTARSRHVSGGNESPRRHSYSPRVQHRHLEPPIRSRNPPDTSCAVGLPSAKPRLA